ncbi:YwbE family protein [Viridibacillus arvi]|uniref:YwbE family protein n=1 Tax=Viridibacillus arvi TaxID=263475 RepID=UPI003D06CD40
MNGQNRSDVKPGLVVDIILKKDQRTSIKTRGVVKDLLTNSSFHPHGIKVRLTDGQIGRVCDIIE